MRTRCWFVLAACFLAATVATASGQTYLDDIGYTRLKTEQGSATPNGAGVRVTQIEAALTMGGDDYFPDTTDSQFSGKTIIARTTPFAVSGHATEVGEFFYGKTSSMTPGITSVDAYQVDGWIEGQFLNTDTNSLPDFTTDRVGNHSYAGYNTLSDNITFDPVSTLDTLHRFDYVIQHDDYINVVAVNDPNYPQEPLMADSFNAITVGVTSGLAPSGTTGDLNDPQELYLGSRAAPEVVAPFSQTSFTTPLVSSAAAMLVGLAHDHPSLSSGSFVSPRTGLTLEYGETNDVIKAAIMAGADRVTHNTSTSDQLNAYGTVGFQTENGLDTRYGAGQLDVYNSYHIIAAGQQGPGSIGTFGFDYSPASSDTAVEDYTFSGHLGVAATLAWNIHIDDSLSATLAKFQLHLYNLTAGGSMAVGGSVSAIDNTQNIYITGLNTSDTYELEVTRTDNLGDWDYGLAWNLTPVPEPGGAPAVAVAVGAMALLRRRNSKLEIRNSNQIPMFK